MALPVSKQPRSFERPPIRVRDPRGSRGHAARWITEHAGSSDYALLSAVPCPLETRVRDSHFRSRTVARKAWRKLNSTSPGPTGLGEWEYGCSARFSRKTTTRRRLHPAAFP